MDYSFHNINDPILPSQNEVALARETSRKLAQNMTTEPIMRLKVQDKEGKEVALDLPASAVRLLLDILENMANGNAVTLSSLQAELTTNQAAELLNVSRPFLIGLLDQGKIPFRKVGTHRRILAEDILAYKQRSYKERKKMMEELTTEAQELNWGYD
ncbi:MAG: helix-turn-helix domain-containing protein [Bacteroidia bacterium]